MTEIEVLEGKTARKIRKMRERAKQSKGVNEK